MNKLSQFARYFTGILFIISGLIKINDPVGTQIKLQEYFEVFAVDISEVFLVFIPYALFLSVFLSVLEVVLGVALLVRYKMKITTLVLLIIIVFFTFLTFYSAYFNKVTDCGCFGDALKLTPWQSFFKDIVLLVLILILFVNRNSFEKARKGGTTGSGIMVAASTVISIAIAWYAIEHLPFIDFRAYKKGNDIGKLMQPSAEYKYSYIMSKGGEEFEFDHYPDEKEGYEYKEIKLENPEAQPLITDFSVWNSEGDFTEQMLQGNVLLIVIHTTDKADTEEIERIKKLAEGIKGTVEPVVLTSSADASYDAFRHAHQLAIPYYSADATLLKTMIRSNPGLMLLKDGMVLEKWHYNDVPAADKVIELVK